MTLAGASTNVGRRGANEPIGPIEVVMVAARFPPYTGGVEVHTFEISRRLAKMGVHVSVLTTDPTGRLPSRELVDGVVVRRVRAWPSRGDLYFAPGLTRWIQPGPRRIIHCQGFHTLVAPLTMASAAARRIPYVVTFHSGGHSSPVRNAIRPAQTLLLAPLLRHAARLIAVSDYEADLFSGRLMLGLDRFAVVANGADLAPLRQGSPTASRESLVVSVGRLERYKGHHRVIAAMPTVAREIPDVRLVIVGKGPYEAALRDAARQAGVADRVKITAIDQDHRSELGALLRRAGLVTLLSEYESQGISVIEALAMGAPVLTSDTSALGDLGRKGLVRTTSLAASDTEIGGAMVRAMRDGGSADLTLPTWDEAAQSLLALYREIV